MVSYVFKGTKIVLILLLISCLSITHSEIRYTVHNPLQKSLQCIIPTLLYQHFYPNTFQVVWSFFNLAVAISKEPHSHTNLSSTMQSILCSTSPASSSSMAESLTFSEVSIFFHYSHQTQLTQRNHILHYNDSWCILRIGSPCWLCTKLPFHRNDRKMVRVDYVC
jgi:hypothetical protein